MSERAGQTGHTPLRGVLVVRPTSRGRFDMSKTCKNCHQQFQPKQEFHKLCYRCWQKSHQALSEYDETIRESARLAEENSELRVRNEILRLENAHLKRQRSSIDRSMINRLIRLCHPDKHGNSAAANEATRWLIAQRR